MALWLGSGLGLEQDPALPPPEMGVRMGLGTGTGLRPLSPFFPGNGAGVRAGTGDPSPSSRNESIDGIRIGTDVGDRRLFPKSSPGDGAGVRTRTGPLSPLCPGNGAMDGIGAGTETGLTSTGARAGTDSRTAMLGLFIIAGARRTWQKVCCRFAHCCVFELLSPQSPGTTQPPRKVLGAVEGHHHLRSLPPPACGCCPREKPSDLRGLKGSWTAAAPWDHVQVAQLFSTAVSTERAPVLPLVFPSCVPR